MSETPQGDPAPGSKWGRRSGLALVALMVALLAWTVRDVDGLRRPRGPDAMASAAGWYSLDPDGLYHTRRVERALTEGLPIAESDPRMNFPAGANVPWPPYYDLTLWALLKPLTPDGSARERRKFLEHAVATLPALFAVLTAALVAASAAFVAGRSGRAPALAALVAGSYFALSRGSINYSVVGCGDHHAWVSLLNTLVLLALGAALGGALRSRRAGALWGLAAGALLGWMIGSWVAAMLYLLNAQLVLAWLLVRRAREPLPGVASLGLALHLAALAVLAPAVLSSPWRAELPWMVVNLSWFHLAQLALGALVFLPPLLFERSHLAPETAGARRYPWLVAAALTGLGLLGWLTGLGPARGIAEGFAWVSRADSFMGTVLESAPLVGEAAGDSGVLFLALGYGVLVLPIAWFLLARESFARRVDALLPWAVSIPPLLVQALAQRRFSEALAAPMAVVLGWGAARWLGSVRARVALPVGLALVAAAQFPGLRVARGQVFPPDATVVGSRRDAPLGLRRQLEWMSDPAPGESGPAGAERGSVLAHWDQGHFIEWAADRPSVATNFGSYIGLDSYRDPARFFLAEELDEAERILRERGVRYVLVPGHFLRNLESMIRIAHPERRNEWLLGRPPNWRTTPRWQRTLGARLLADGVVLTAAGPARDEASNPPGFLRLVHPSPYFDTGYRNAVRAEPERAGYVWEHVAGARVEARGSPGESLRVRLVLEYASSRYGFEWEAVAAVDASGRAELRVPYSTEGPNGFGAVREATWSLGTRGGPLAIPESAVRAGAAVAVP